MLCRVFMPLAFRHNALHRIIHADPISIVHTLKENRWSILSIVIAFIGAAAIFCTVRYLYWHGLWAINSGAYAALRISGAIVFFASLGAACVGVKKDASKVLPMVALAVCLLSFLFYVQ